MRWSEFEASLPPFHVYILAAILCGIIGGAIGAIHRGWLARVIASVLGGAGVVGTFWLFGIGDSLFNWVFVTIGAIISWGAASEHESSNTRSTNKNEPARQP